MSNFMKFFCPKPDADGLFPMDASPLKRQSDWTSTPPPCRVTGMGKTSNQFEKMKEAFEAHRVTSERSKRDPSVHWWYCPTCKVAVGDDHTLEMAFKAVAPIIEDEARNRAADNYYHGKVGNVRIWLRNGAEAPTFKGESK